MSLCRSLINDINLCGKNCQANIVIGNNWTKKYITFINDLIIGTINVDGEERVRKRSYLSQSTIDKKIIK